MAIHTRAVIASGFLESKPRGNPFIRFCQMRIFWHFITIDCHAQQVALAMTATQILAMIEFPPPIAEVFAFLSPSLAEGD